MQCHGSSLEEKNLMLNGQITESKCIRATYSWSEKEKNNIIRIINKNSWKVKKKYYEKNEVKDIKFMVVLFFVQFLKQN